MFVRKVSVRLKSNTLGEFATLIESEVLPCCERKRDSYI
jgi:hypothetical protein